MNIKVISIISLMILAIGVWFFYKEDVEIKPALPEAPDASYEVTQIKATQTNPQTGEVEYTVIADSLVQNSAGQDEMLGVHMDWQPPSGAIFELQSAKAMLNQADGEMMLSQGFTLTKKGSENQEDMVIQGDLLTGNTKTRLLRSDQPITVTQGEDSFKAQGFTADLNTLEYQFDKIEMVFNPPTRVNKSLF